MSPFALSCPSQHGEQASITITVLQLQLPTTSKLIIKILLMNYDWSLEIRDEVLKLVVICFCFRKTQCSNL